MTLQVSDFPPQPDFRLTRAQVPSCLLEEPGSGALSLVDIDIRDGKIDGVYLAGGGPEPTAPMLDVDRGQVWPGFVDLHTHLDKGHIWPRAENPDGTFMSALETVQQDRVRHWSAEDLAARMDFALRCAYAHGTVAIRTHLDSQPPQHAISWPVFTELRKAWADRIALQAVCLVTLDDEIMGPFGERLADLVAASGGVLGAVTIMDTALDQRLERIFKLAVERDLELDFHVDESGDLGAVSLRHIAEIALRLNFPGNIVVGHCCSLAQQSPETVEETLAKVKAANISVVSLPMCNLYLQDRVPGRTPRWRGVTLLHELAAAGIPVSLGSDNVRDPFYGYGDLDMLEVFTQAVRIAHLDRPIDPWPASVTRTPARIMGLAAGTIAAGASADLVICTGRGFSELLSRPQSRRIVLRAGRPIDTTPPDYRELDDLFTKDTLP